MGEKRGGLEKLRYDFPTEGVLEVYNSNKDTWYRSTSREFRSYDGRRRITRPVQQPSQGPDAFQDIEFITEEYFGPYYMYATNIEVPYQGTNTIISSPHYEKAFKISGSRA